MRLEFGSGYRPTAGFEHVDMNPNCPDVDHVLNVFGPLPWPDGSVAEIRAVDVWEHETYHRSEDVLREWARVLAPGGRMFVQVPDAEVIMSTFVGRAEALIVPQYENLPRGEAALMSAAWRLLGGHLDDEYAKPGDDWRWNAHYCLMSEGLVRHYAARVGLHVESLARNAFPNLQVWLTKPETR